MCPGGLLARRKRADRQTHKYRGPEGMNNTVEIEYDLSSCEGQLYTLSTYLEVSFKNSKVSLTAVLHLRILTKAINEYSVAHAYSHHYNPSPKLFTQQLRIHSSMDGCQSLPTNPYPPPQPGPGVAWFWNFDLEFNIGIVTGIRRSKPKNLLIDGWR